MSHAPIETSHIVNCCNEQRKQWKMWLQRRNKEFDDDLEQRIKNYKEGGWFYRLMFTRPTEKEITRLKNIQYHMNKLKCEDCVERIEDIEALAAKSIDGTVMLDTNDARFLHINE